jgi:hypothetical protein
MTITAIVEWLSGTSIHVIVTSSTAEHWVVVICPLKYLWLSKKYMSPSEKKRIHRKRVQMSKERVGVMEKRVSSPSLETGT